MNKTEFMEFVINNGWPECFEHSELGMFDVSSTRKVAVVKGERRYSDLTSDVIAFIKDNRVWDSERVDNLDKESWLNDPALVIDMPDGSHLLIDGTHRILRRAKEGLDTFIYLAVTLELAVRPNENKYYRATDINLDWGDKIVDGKIVKE